MLYILCTYLPCCGRTCIVVHSWMVLCPVCTWQQYWEELVTLFTISRWLLKAREVSVLTDGRGPSLLLHVTLYGTHNWPPSFPPTDASHRNSTLSPSNTTDPRELVSTKEVSASSSLHKPLLLLPLPTHKNTCKYKCSQPWSVNYRNVRMHRALIKPMSDAKLVH